MSNTNPIDIKLQSNNCFHYTMIRTHIKSQSKQSLNKIINEQSIPDKSQYSVENKTKE